MSKLVIVESPTKARTIGKMLDSSYKIAASMGHVRDLPERSIGVDIANNFAPLYVDTPRSKKIVAELKSLAKDADEIYLAPDPDREGEAIAWHLQEVLKGRKKIPFHRVSFHEITSGAIHKAMENKGEINMNLVDSQQARRILDRIVGYKVSPLLWQKLEKGMSAGRVQSVALRLIVERERLINDFKPEEYWLFTLVFKTANGVEIPCKLFKINGENFKITCETDANKLLENVLEGDTPVILSIAKTEKKRYAQPPFTTSTLQQSASSSLHMSPSSTMMHAQALYEGMDLGVGGSVGLITYMRTDSVNIAHEAQVAAANFIRKSYGENYLPSKFNFYKSKGSAQEAHEAIRPTDVNRTPDSIREFLDDSQFKLYRLIWQRFVASQMAPAVNNLTTIDIGVNGKDHQLYDFRNSISTPKFLGFAAVYPPPKSEDELSMDGKLADSIEKLAKNEAVKIKNANKEQKFTEPPPHFSEASLIKELEDNGIGRPSTYASIIKTILQRNYVGKEKGKLIPTESGYKVNDFLVSQLDALFDVGFTALMEAELDKIEDGKLVWTDMLKNFYDKFAGWLDLAKNHDAPEANDASALLKLMVGLQFNPPEKSGRRTFDDGKFVKSVADKFAKDNTISAKQYSALLKIGAKYFDQLKDIPEPFKSEITQLKLESDKQAAEAENRPAQKLEKAFAALAQVKWDDAPKSGRGFDEKKFFTSLQKQFENGKVLSEKQLSVLKRMVQKYSAQFEAQKNEIFADLAMDSIAETAEETTTVSSEKQDEIKALLAKLSMVSNWAEPSKKGRFVRDDKAFYQSLAKQFESGKVLSPKQLSALQKLADKY